VANNNIIKKSHELVEARYNLNIWEIRVFVKMISLLHQNDHEFATYRIYIKDMIRDFEAENNKDVYNRIKVVPENLMKKIISIPYVSDEGEERILKTTLLSSITQPQNLKVESFIEVSFDPKLKPYLLQLKEKFLMYDIRNILRLSSPYTVRMYEFLKQYEKIGIRVFQVEDLKRYLFVEEKYSRYFDFKKRIILHSQKKLKQHTDISFSFEEIKNGRRVVAIRFFIEKNKPKFNSNKTSDKSDKNRQKHSPIFQELYPKVRDWISKEVLLQLLKKHPEQQIRNAITYTLNRITKGDVIENIGGHIVAMSKQVSLFDMVEEKKKEQQQRINKRQQQRKQQDKKKLLEQKLNQLKEEKYQAIDPLVLNILQTEEQILREIKQLLSNGTFRSLNIEAQAGSDYEKVKKMMEQSELVQGTVIGKVIKRVPQYFEQINKKYNSQITRLERQINMM